MCIAILPHRNSCHSFLVRDVHLLILQLPFEHLNIIWLIEISDSESPLYILTIWKRPAWRSIYLNWSIKIWIYSRKLPLPQNNKTYTFRTLEYLLTMNEFIHQFAGICLLFPFVYVNPLVFFLWKSATDSRLLFYCSRYTNFRIISKNQCRAGQIVWRKCCTRAQGSCLNIETALEPCLTMRCSSRSSLSNRKWGCLQTGGKSVSSFFSEISDQDDYKKTASPSLIYSTRSCY